MITYEEYENLVIKHDQLLKESQNIMISYTREFGELIAELFEKKMSCIEKKKSISFCQALVNQNKKIDINALNAHLDQEMQKYKDEYKQLVSNVENSKNAKPASEHAVQKSKALYRKLAKMIHPDINAKLYEDEEDTFFPNIWLEIMAAYSNNDPIRLSELEVLVVKELKDREIDVEEPEIEDIDFKAEELKRDIDRIETTDPYLYKFLLDDYEAVEEKKNSLKDEIKEYSEYEQELQKILAQIMMSNGVTVEWEKN